MVAHAEIRVVHLGGSKINFREPVITNDSRYIVADMIWHECKLNIVYTDDSLQKLPYIVLRP
uniref:Uncharacterized protein n=1 Tax=Oncorhynchus mykiss TaxID=8022 RepID=A0A8K9XPQ2_ONCMY